MEASWRWGVLLIVLTMVIHAAAVVMMAFAGLSLDQHRFRPLGTLVVGNLDRIADVDNVGN